MKRVLIRFFIWFFATATIIAVAIPVFWYWVIPRWVIASGSSDFQVTLGHIYRDHFNPQIAREFFLAASEQENAEGQFELGHLYYWGIGGSQDIVQARNFFEKAAQKGHTAGSYWLGRMYYFGLGGHQDLSLARTFFEQASVAGYPDAQLDFGKMLYWGQGGPQDREYAHALWKRVLRSGLLDDIDKLWDNRLSDNSYTRAHYWLGLSILRAYLNATTPPSDSSLPDAVAHLHIAAQYGHPIAPYVLQLSEVSLQTLKTEGQKVFSEKMPSGKSYEIALEENPNEAFTRGLFYYLGLGAMPNPEKANTYWERAGKLGSADANFILAMSDIESKGGLWELSRELDRLNRASEEGLAAAQYHLGWIAFWGRRWGGDDTLAQVERGFQLLHRSSDQGYTPAQFEVGLMSALNMAKDEVLGNQGIVLLQQAALKGHAPALYELGYMRLVGADEPPHEAKSRTEEEVQQAETDGIRLLKAAQEQGYTPATEELRRLDPGKVRAALGDGFAAPGPEIKENSPENPCQAPQ